MWEVGGEREGWRDRRLRGRAGGEGGRRRRGGAREVMREIEFAGCV